MSMLKEKAVVISYEAGIAQVRFQPVKSCSGCGEQQGCGVSALSALTGEPTHCIFSVPSLMPLKAGQQVEIGLPERSLFVSIFWLYVVPLIVLLASTILSEKLGITEGLRLLVIIISTALSFLLVRFYSNKLHQRTAYQPVLLRVLN